MPNTYQRLEDLEDDAILPESAPPTRSLPNARILWLLALIRRIEAAIAILLSINDLGASPLPGGGNDRNQING